MNRVVPTDCPTLYLVRKTQWPTRHEGHKVNGDVRPKISSNLHDKMSLCRRLCCHLEGRATLCCGNWLT